jgi:dihydroneopterin aldolase
MGISCRCHVGVPTSERRRPQKISVDVGLEIPRGLAPRQDDFRLAVDYQAVEESVRREAETGQRALVETLAEKISQRILTEQPLVAAVTVRVIKKPKVMPKTQAVIVEIYRTNEKKIHA